jgi:predicted oxidoreductase
MAWSPRGGGRLFENTSEQSIRLLSVMAKIGREYGDAALDQIALDWIFRHPAGFLPVLGIGKTDRIRAAVSATEIQRSRQHWFAIWEASKGHRVP